MNYQKYLLNSASFGILMALSLRPRHGYEIMKQIEEDSGGNTKIGPGALYTNIKSLNDAGLIEEIDDTEGSRRRCYRLTNEGWTQLNAELDYLDGILKMGRSRNIYEGFQWERI